MKKVLLLASILLSGDVLASGHETEAAPGPVQQNFFRPRPLEQSPHAHDYSIASLSPERQIIWNLWIQQFKELYPTGVTRAQIDEFDQASFGEKSTFALLRVQIIDQKVYFASYNKSMEGWAYLYVTYLRKVLEKYKVNNVDLVICLKDFVPLFRGKKVSMPILHSDRIPVNQENRNIILQPDSFMTDQGRWPRIYKAIKDAHAKHPWNNKKDVILWRGARTGPSSGPLNFEYANYQSLPRLKLVMQSLDMPDKIDARFVDLDLDPVLDLCRQIPTEKAEELRLHLKKLTGSVPRMAEVDHLTHKYLISIDGMVSAWLRPEWIMASNSVLLFQHHWEQWYYPVLKPWVHYVPLKEDISDIFEQLEWLKTHDKEAEQISKNANRLVESVLAPDFILEDMAFLLNQYASLQKFTLVEPNDAVFNTYTKDVPADFNAAQYLLNYPHVQEEAVTAKADPHVYAKNHYMQYKDIFVLTYK